MEYVMAVADVVQSYLLEMSPLKLLTVFFMLLAYLAYVLLRLYRLTAPGPDRKERR
jgi:hypothetical protein